MHYLIVYGKEEENEFKEWKDAIRNRQQFYSTRICNGGMGIMEFKIENKLNDDVYLVLEESEALKYYGGCALYLNEIYCTNSVDDDAIRKLYEACIRKYTPFVEIGLIKYNFKNVIEEYQKRKTTESEEQS